MNNIEIVPMENNFINNNKNYRNCMEHFRESYESFMGIDSENHSYQAYTLDEQIERYSKNIAFWYIQLDKIKNSYGKNSNKLLKVKFIKEQILRLINNSHDVFPDDVPSLIHENALNMKLIYS